MFTVQERKYMLDAVDAQIKSMKRMATSRPEFSEVANQKASELSSLRLKLEKIDGEAQAPIKK